MNTLVTGATGFVGSHVARQLVGAGDCVRALVRRNSNLQFLEGLPVERVEGDLRDAASLLRAMQGVQRVFHVAADYRLWAKHPAEIYESNVGGTRKLFEAAKRAGVERVVFTSTVATMAVPVHEGALPNEETHASLDQMIGHYKRSKFLAEQEALEAARGGLPVVIVNPTAPLGPGDWKPTPTGRIILDFLNGQMPAYVDTGLNFIAVEDVAKGHWLAGERGQIGARYILGDRNLTLKQLLEILSALSGRPMPRLCLPHAVPILAALADSLAARLLGRPPRIPLEGVRLSRHKMFVDCSKARRELGFQPSSLEAALDSAIQWYGENGYLKERVRNRAARECAA